MAKKMFDLISRLGTAVWGKGKIFNFAEGKPADSLTARTESAFNSTVKATTGTLVAGTGAVLVSLPVAGPLLDHYVDEQAKKNAPGVICQEFGFSNGEIVGGPVVIVKGKPGDKEPPACPENLPRNITYRPSTAAKP